MRFPRDREGEREGRPKREECRSLLDRSWSIIPHVSYQYDYKRAELTFRLLLDHYKKFPVNPTGGLMLTK